MNMDDPNLNPPREPISPRRLRWLSDQLAAWQGAGIVGADQAASILARYETPEGMGRRRTQRLFLALCGLAALMCAAGVLMLIGFNWDQVPRPAKVLGIFASVAAAFAVSAGAYWKGRPVIGEVAAFAGTLLYGCAIWLLAQVYHIGAHYPDGVMWWMIGTLAMAWLVDSRLIGAAAVILLGIWASVEAADFGDPNYLALPFTAATVALAYRLRSSMLLGMSAACGALWLVMVAAGPWNLEEAAVHVLVLLAAAYYGAGLLHGPRTPFGRTWHFIGVTILLACLLPLGFTEFHRYNYPAIAWGMQPLFDTPLPAFATITLALAGFTAFAFLRASAAAMKSDWPIALSAGLAIVSLFVTHSPWTAPYVTGESGEPYPQIMAVVFSGLIVATAIWLILRGVHMDRALSFFTGVAYLLIFVLVRWFDLIGDMVSSAMLFLAAGGVLFGTALYWRRRRSHGEPLTEGRHA